MKSNTQNNNEVKEELIPTRSVEIRTRHWYRRSLAIAVSRFSCSWLPQMNVEGQPLLSSSLDNDWALVGQAQMWSQTREGEQARNVKVKWEM